MLAWFDPRSNQTLDRAIVFGGKIDQVRVRNIFD